MASTIRNAPFSPVFTGALLYALTSAPLSIRQPLISHLTKYLSPTNLARLTRSLQFLLALGLARALNALLSTWSLNNFRLRSERAAYDWPAEIVVVTGGAGAFGSLFAKDLTARGVGKVVLLDILDALPADLAANPRIAYYKCDISSRATVMRAAEQIRAEHGEPSILINNAGVPSGLPILEISEHALHNVFNVNVISHYFLLQAFLPAMIARKKGHVLAVASMGSFASAPRMGPYSSAKAGVLSLWEGLGQELRMVHHAPQIKNSIVFPTLAATPMTVPMRGAIASKGLVLLDPQVVSDAVVAQIMSCRSGRIVLHGGHGLLSNMRGWPSWVGGVLVWADERKWFTLRW